MRHEVVEGQVLAGKYRVERVLGEGGMGVVVAARHLQLDERVALKFMKENALVSTEAVARFGREARAAVKIKSEHVARVSDVGVLENGAPYMVMEHLEGGDLSGWLDEKGPLPLEQAVDFLLQACEAIAEAHALGIVHRDLKPANLFVIRRPDGALSVKVLDFGISKMTGNGNSAPDFDMTKTTAVMGSPKYMSPEQMRSVKSVDCRSDIWALGVILYELLADTTPFVADEFPELVLKIATEPPDSIRNRLPNLPPGVENVILKCLEKDAGRRYQTVGELAVALIEFAPRRSKLSLERISGVLKAAGMSESAMVLPPSSEMPPPPVDAGTAASWGKTSGGAPGSKRALLVGAAVLGAGALGAFVYSLASAGPRAAPVVAPAALVPAVTSVVQIAEPTPAPASAPIEIATVTPPAPSTPASPASAAAPPLTPRPRLAAAKSRPASAAEPPKPAPPKSTPAAPAVPAPTPKKTSVFDDR
jgi:serine/threonine protein kinase